MKWLKYEESGNPTMEIAFKREGETALEKVVFQDTDGLWNWLVNIYPNNEEYKKGVSTSKVLAKLSANASLKKFLKGK